MTSKEFYEIKKDYTEVLDALCQSEYFRDFLRTGEVDFYYSAIDDFYNYDDIDRYDLYFTNGKTKEIIIDYESDWILKIPFYKSNFCQKEAIYYAQAQKEGLEKAFAPCYFLMNYKGANCYIMERVDCDEDRISDEFYESMKEFNNYSDEEAEEVFWNYDEFDKVDELLEYNFDENFLEKLMNFLRENDINDLHAGNIGYRGDDLVLVDYSGYGEI